MSRTIYLDNAATTPPDPEIIAGMAEHEVRAFGNPASPHEVGRTARALLESSRERLATALGARPDDVILTSGGTEANGLAILGSAGDTPARIAISAIEHSSVKESAVYLRDRFGWTIDILPVDANGRVVQDALAEHLSNKTRIVSTMLVNGEIGCINDVAKIARAVKRYAPRARHLVDAVQGFGKLPFSVQALGIDCLSVASHKLHGPKGIGALWCRHTLRPILKGGGQEGGRRGGTQSGPLAWAFAEAYDRQVTHRAHLESLRDRLWAGLQARLPDISLTGPVPGSERVIHNLHVCIPGLPTEPVINALSAAGVYASGGSACSTGRFSAVLKALGRRSEDGAYLRFTVGRFNTPEEIDIALDIIAEVVAELRTIYE